MGVLNNTYVSSSGKRMGGCNLLDPELDGRVIYKFISKA
jgi:hypothetical protein